MRKPIGFLTHDHPYRTPYFAIRYNEALAHLSDKPLGWQALTEFLDGSLVWINVKKEWIA